MSEPERIAAAALQIEGFTVSLPPSARHGQLFCMIDGAHKPRKSNCAGLPGQHGPVRHARRGQAPVKG